MGVVRSIGSAIAWSTSGVVVLKVVTLANILLILNQLSVYEYGLTELTFSVVSAAGIFMLPGLVPAVVADLGVERSRGNLGRMKAIFLEYFGFSMLLGTAAWAVLFFGSSLVAGLTNNMLIEHFFKIVSFLFLTSPLRAVTTMMATVFARFVDQSFYGVVEEVAKGILLLIFFFGLDRGADGLLFAAVLAQVVAVLVFLPRTISAYRTFSSAQMDTRVSIFNILSKHRKWGVGAAYVGQLGQNIRLWLIKLFLGTEAVGLFAFAFGLISHAIGLVPVGTVLHSLAPAYVDRRNEFARLIRGAMKLQLGIISVGIVAGLLIGPWFVTNFFAKFESAIPLVMILLFSMLPNGLGSVLNPAFTALKEQKSFFFAVVIKTISTAVLTPLFILAAGFYGIGLELICTSALAAAERVWRLRRLVPQFSFSWHDVVHFDPVEFKLLKAVLSRVGAAWLMRFVPER